jgi:hypothetical protein
LQKGNPGEAFKAASPEGDKEVLKAPRREYRPELLPEHLSSLMDGISTELTPKQRRQLAGALMSYQDVFSKDADDMG